MTIPRLVGGGLGHRGEVGNRSQVVTPGKFKLSTRYLSDRPWEVPKGNKISGPGFRDVTNVLGCSSQSRTTETLDRGHG